MTTSISATTETTILRLTGLPKGVYVATTYVASNTNNIASGLLGIRATNQTVLTPIGNSLYRINGSVSNVIELTNTTDEVSVFINTIDSVTLSYGRLKLVRIA